MGKVSINKFLQDVQKERNNHFKSSAERAYDAFVELGYDKKRKEYFFNNASSIVEKMREKCWEDYCLEEDNFTIFMLKKLIDSQAISKMKPQKAVEWYLNSYPEHIYQLSLSNTQSRRSRAGKEFESIIELILMGAGIPMESQGNLGKEHFVEKGLGKMVDVVSPGVIEYEINKRKTVLISAKTTLRERWQEVPEEMGRIGASEMFLATLDDSASSNVLETLYEANIHLATTKNNKELNYLDNERVISFEELLQICKENFDQWKEYKYTIAQSAVIIEALNKGIEKKKEQEFIIKKLKDRVNIFEASINEK